MAKNSRPAGDIRLDVLQTLGESDKVDISALDVQVEGSTVRLLGEVSTPEQKDMAEELTKYVPGVENVENHIIVMAPTPLNQFPSVTADRPPVQ
ncbi:MAG TPA: BON domain-containing protein [Chloroflexia bacterium]|nr:BON domain-containing protein [Chloroflexia bacterium]